MKPSVAAVMSKVECKKYPKAVWNSMTKEQQMQIKNCMNNKASSPLQSRLLYILDHKEYNMSFHMESLDLSSMESSCFLT